MASLAFDNDKITDGNSAFMELPDEEEKKMLVQLRDALKQDMERSKSCKEFPEIVSDYKLIRYIRGYEGVDGAVAAYRKMLRTRETYPEIYDYRKNLVGEDIENAIGPMDLLKYCKTDQERKEMEAVINIGKELNGMTSDGIPYIYRCWADTEFQNAHEVLGKKPQEYFHKIIKKPILDGILMELRLDALSKKNNKIARMIWIGDSTGYSFSKFRSNIKDGPWKIFVDHYFPKDENNKGPFETYAPESVGIILLVNTPWYLVKIYNWIIKTFFPARVQQKIVVLGKDYKKRLLAFMDPSSVDRIMKHRGVDDEDDLPLSKPDLKMKKGKVKEVPVSGKPGDTIEWTFNVTKNTVDFSLILYVPGKDGEVEERIILEPQRCNIDDEEIQGDYEIEDLSEEADNGGTKDTEYLLGLRFSNKHSLLRTTKVAYDIKITKEED